ncbi:hypothetical protein O6H91_20G076800 [Diphasiastrum complanatum]|nr:hypothetical protein O6H91_20G076800 [Diphasiastrum complanatum]
MYYQKRPQLVKHVHDLYGAYCSLVEHYDHLTGNISQNVPKALQTQYGISCDSPRNIPFDKQRQFKIGFDSPCNVPKSSSSFLIEMSQQVTGAVNSELAGHSRDLSAESLTTHQGHESYSDKTQTTHQEDESYSDVEYEHANQGTEKSHKSLVSLRAKNDILKKECGRLEEANNRLINELSAAVIVREKLEEEISCLQKEKVDLKDESTQQINALKKEIHLRQEKDLDHRKKIVAGFQQIQKLGTEIEFLQDQKRRLEHEVLSGYEQEKYVLRAIQIIKVEVSKYVQKSKRMRKEHNTLKFADRKKTSDLSSMSKDVELPSLYEEVVDLSAKITELQHELLYLQEKDERQRALLLEISEEKREAIRQLCSSMDMVNTKNKRLEETINRYHRRIWNMRNQNNYRSSTPGSSWNSLFSFQWMKPDPRSYALAL